MQACFHPAYNRERYIDVTEARQYRLQQFSLVFNNHHESSGCTEQLDTSSKGRLRIASQIIGIGENNCLDMACSIHVHVGAAKELQLIPNKADSLPMSAVHIHHISRHQLPILSIEPAYEAID